MLSRTLIATGLNTLHAEFNPVKVVLGAKYIVGNMSYELRTWKRSSALLDKGIVAADPIITHRVPLKDVAEGFELAARKEAIKVLLTP